MPENYYRSFLAGLQYDGKSGIPIFSKSELSSEPIKWLKRLLLVRFGLSSESLLNSEICRFSMSDIEKGKMHCLKLTNQATQNGSNFMIVLKPVPKNTTGQIKNYRIYRNEDVETVFDDLKMYYQTNDREIWFCLSIVDDTTLSLGGRLAVPRIAEPEVIELVWYTSPRMIEELRSKNFGFPYWRGYRDVGQLLFKTHEIFIPSQYGGLTIEAQNRYFREAENVVQNVWWYKDAINDLCALLFLNGVNWVTLEFRVNSGDLAFIDLDTDKDLC